jgi:hypothetical protein
VNTSGTATATEFWSSISIPGNIWQHVAVTYDGATWSFYLTGKLGASSTAASAPAAGTNLYLGYTPWGTAYYPFGGLIDDVRIYNRVLSAAEVSALYNAEK